MWTNLQFTNFVLNQLINETTCLTFLSLFCGPKYEKHYHFRQFITQIEKYLCEIKGKEILEKVSKRREEGGLGLINVKESIQAIQALEFLKADMQKPETDNLFEVGWKQKALYGRMFHGGKSEKAKDMITVICDKINEIKRFKMNHKSVKAKNIQDILFPEKEDDILQRDIWPNRTKISVN